MFVINVPYGRWKRSARVYSYGDAHDSGVKHQEQMRTTNISSQILLVGQNDLVGVEFRTQHLGISLDQRLIRRNPFITR